MYKQLNVFKVINKSLNICIRSRSSSGSYENIFKGIPKTQYSELHSGLTVATEERNCPHVCFGFYIDAGSRHENDLENGLTHFFQHIAFKGTENRSKTNLEKEISSTGAKFKCFATRDITVYCGQCLAKHFCQAVDILYDCVFNNAFSCDELETQRTVIQEEMLKHDESTVNILYDYLHSTAFQGTQLGQTIMGTSNNLCKFQMPSVRNHVKKMFIPQRTVLAAVGGVTHDTMVNIGNKYFRKTKDPKCIFLGPCRYTGSEISYRDDSMPMGHVAIAVEGPPFSSKDKIFMDLAASYIGGWDTSQPGGTNHGTYTALMGSAGRNCESYKTFQFVYNDTSLWGAQFISPRIDLDDMLYIIQDTWMRLCDLITDGELIRPKSELKSKILMQNQSTEKACHDIGQHLLRTGNRPTIADRFREIDNITAKQLKKVCDKYIYDRCPVVVGIGSIECLYPYTNVRDAMRWLRV